MLIGNVGKEPDVRYFEADQCIAEVRLATTERGYTLANGTRVPDRTDWHTAIFSKNLAKIVERYVHTGDRMYVEGKLRYRSFDDRKGMKHYVTEIYVDNMELLSPKPQQQAPSTSQQQDADNTDTADTQKLPF